MNRIEALLKPRSSDSWLVGYLLGMYGWFAPKIFPAADFLNPCRSRVKTFQKGEKKNHRAYFKLSLISIPSQLTPYEQ